MSASAEPSRSTINMKLAQALGYRIAGRRGRSTRDIPSMGVAATAESLDKLLREGRAEFTTGAVALDAAPPAAPGEIRRRPAPRHQVRLRAEGRPAAGDQGAGRGREAPRPQPGAARRHRLGQDLHHGEGDRGDAAPGADPRAEQDARGAALRRVQELLSRQRGRVFRLAITTTTSPKPTSRAPTPISRRNPRSTSRSTACATRRRARCSNATT